MNSRTERTAMTDTNRAEPMKKSPDEIRHLFNGNPLAAYEQGWRDRAAEVEASRLPQAGAAPPLVQWGPILDALDGLPNDLRDEFEHLDQLIRREHERGLAFLDASPAPSDAAVQQPVAWLCAFVREDGGTELQVVMQDPEGTRWADMPDGDGVSPYSVMPLYTRPAGLPTAPAGAREAMVPAWKLQQSETRMLNMKLDLIRVAQGEATLCNFPEVEELRAALAAAPLDRIAQIDDDSDALTIAYMHGFASGKRYGITLAQGEAKGDGNG